MADIKGFCQPRFEPIRTLLHDRCYTGLEIGVSFAVDIGGESVIDLWGGYTDAQRTRSWQHDTTVPIWSISKVVTSLAVLMLVDRGQISLYEKISTYWPEFAVNGKSNIELRHILSHTSGLSGFMEPITLQEASDSDIVAGLLAAQKPWWQPGTASGYHAGTWGHLVSQAVKRATSGNVTLQHFIQAELVSVLDVKYGYIGGDKDQVAEIVTPAVVKLPVKTVPEPDSICARTLLNPPRDAKLANNGKAICSNSRSLVAILSVISRGGLAASDQRLLRSEIVDKIFEEQCYGEDLVLQTRLRWGLGCALAADGDDADDEWLGQRGGRVCYWGGWGGSVVVMDRTRQITIAFVMNKMENVPIAKETARACVKAVYDIILAA